METHYSCHIAVSLPLLWTKAFGPKLWAKALGSMLWAKALGPKLWAKALEQEMLYMGDTFRFQKHSISGQDFIFVKDRINSSFENLIFRTFCIG